jgi:hypothetical protein
MFTPEDITNTIDLSPGKEEDLPWKVQNPFKEDKRTLDKFEMKIRNNTHTINKY